MQLHLIAVLTLSCVLVLVYSDNLCPTEYVDISGDCIYFSNDATTWYEAFKRCRSKRGMLLSVEDIGKMKGISNYINDKLFNGYWWIGANDLEKRFNWVWAGTEDEMEYRNWCPNEPDNAFGHESCVTITSWHNDHCWNDWNCTMSFRYICERVS